jgi:DNA helicase-2/ATP-dependent DNA helicase PcrA
MAGKIIDNIIEKIKAGKNFLLSGGAGSGKTHSLMEVLNFIHSEYPFSNVACITYTNVAVEEIKERAPYKNIKAATIHDFLWETIQNYQKDIKISLIELLQSEIEEKNSGIKYSGERTIDNNFFNSIEKIKYKDYRKIEEGIISHNDILKLANHMYKKYDLLCKILIDKYQFILIDEYQDAEQQVIEIFLDFLPRITHKNNIIGFFGDAMQSIYDTGIGDLNKYIEEGKVTEIKKADNWRCSVEVINLINKIRIDGIIQEPKGDNAKREGSIKFLYSNDKLDIDIIKSKEYFNNWDITNPKETKELYLTHNLIANKAGFGVVYNVYSKDEIIKQAHKIKKKLKGENRIDEIKDLTFGEVVERKIVNEAPNFKKFIEENDLLFEYAKKLPFEELSKVYLDKEKLVGDNKDFLIKHLYKIQDLIYFYENNDINSFVRNCDFKIKSVEDKIKLKKLIDNLKDVGHKSISEVIDFADKNELIIKDDLIKQFIAENNYLFYRLKDINYEQIINLYRFEQDFTPYSTQHGIKGAEFNNVFVILDNGKWNKYNFKYLFENTAGKESIIERTRKMFYVSCSRAKDNLIVYYNNPSNEVLNRAKEWFGENNLIEIQE